MYLPDITAPPQFPLCRTALCRGSRLSDADGCLAHVDEPRRRESLLRLLGGEAIPLYGTPLDQELLNRIVGAYLCRQREGARPVMIDLRGARLLATELHVLSGTANVRLDHCETASSLTCSGGAGRLVLAGASISGNLNIAPGWVTGSVELNEVQVNGDLRMYAQEAVSSAARGGPALLQATAPAIATSIRAMHSRVRGNVLIENINSSGLLQMVQCQIDGTASMLESHFAECDLSDVTVNEEVLVRGLTAEVFKLDRVTLDGGAHIEVNATAIQVSKLACRTSTRISVGTLPPAASERQQRTIRGASLTIFESNFEGPAHLSVDAARTDLIRCEFAAESEVQLGPGATAILDTMFHRPSIISRNRKVDGSADSARLVALTGPDLSRLLVSDLDLQDCRFGWYHSLGDVVLESVKLRSTPRRGLRVRRQTLADEQIWRMENSRARAWRERGYLGLDPTPRHAGSGEHTGHVDPSDHPALDAGDADRLYVGPAELTMLYRALRKARETAKDEPGAWHFYYGEMEMRRYAASGLFERGILWLYWASSGYGLRARRAVGALLLWVAAATAAVTAEKYFSAAPTKRPRLDATAIDAVLEMLRTATRIRVSGEHTGDLIDLVVIATAIAGPVLLGLAALALRSSVKR